MEHYVQRLVEGLGIDENLYPNMLISLTEAVTNAMVHGNRYDNRKQILLMCRQESGHIHFFITDEGSGFNPCNLPDPTQAEYIEKEGGRGVYLMRQLCDELKFHDEGRTVQLMWKI